MSKHNRLRMLEAIGRVLQNRHVEFECTYVRGSQGWHRVEVRSVDPREVPRKFRVAEIAERIEEQQRYEAEREIIEFRELS